MPRQIFEHIPPVDSALKQQLDKLNEEKEMKPKEITRLLLQLFPEHLPIWGFLERCVKDEQKKEQNRGRTKN